MVEMKTEHIHTMGLFDRDYSEGVMMQEKLRVSLNIVTRNGFAKRLSRELIKTDEDTIDCELILEIARH